MRGTITDETQENKRELYKKDDFEAQKNLAVAKLLFFCGSMGSVGWNRFQTIFYLHNGLSASQIGTLKSIGLILKFFGEPFWCLVADVTDQKNVFALCVMFQVTTMEILRWVTLNFETILMVKILRTTTAPSGTFTTTVSFALTKKSKEGYGQQRLFGSLAWGAGSLLVGSLIDEYGLNSIFWYTYFFNFVSLFLVLLGIPSKLLKDAQAKSSVDGKCSPAIQDEEESDDASKSLLEKNFGSGAPAPPQSFSAAIATYFSEFKQFFQSVPCRVLLINALMYGIAMTVPDNFLYLSLENDFHTSRTFNGLCTTISIISCLPLFWYSDCLIKLHGHHKIISLAQQVCVCRMVVLAFISPKFSWGAHAIAATQLIHGVNFALFWAAAVDGIKRLSPPGLGTSCMATLNIFFFTLSGIFAHVIWGMVYDSMGIAYVYIFAATFLALYSAYFATQAAVINGALPPIMD